MWAITSYYNPVGYKRRLSNYRHFRSNLGIPLVTVELSFDGAFELEKGDAEILIQISGGAVVWQKERLLNLALKAIPSDVVKLAWLDCDLIIGRPDWVAEAEKQLDQLDIVQLFSEAVHLTSEDFTSGVAERKLNHASVPGIMRLANGREIILIRSNSHFFQSGFAWAANKTLLEKHGFYDAAIVGGGDCFMVGALYGEFEGIARRFMLSDTRREHYLEWAVPFHNSVGGRFGYMPGTIYHLSHGTMENRQYADRHQPLADLNFSPYLDLKIGASGAWEWARPRPELKTALMNYFVARAEDA